MFASFLNRKPIKKIELDLSCSTEEAKAIIAGAIDNSHKHPFLPSYVEGPDFQGELKDYQFSIFTKWPRRGRPPATIEGHIIPNGSVSKVIANIMVFPTPKFLSGGIQFKIVCAVIVAISFPFTIIGTLKHTAWQPISFVISMVSMGCLLFSLFGSKGEEEADELEIFFNRLFKGSTKRPE
jgi:hypothetical protein